MNEIKKVFEGNEIRVVEKGGNPWFVLADVCKALGLGTPAKVADRVDDDEKGMNQIHTLGGVQALTVVNESGLYSVILRSDKPEAKRFKKWVTSEVLPSIRKNGGYLSPVVDFSEPDNIQKILDAWKVDRAKRLEAENRVDRLVHSNRTFPSTEIAKELGLRSAQELHKKLQDSGILFKDRRGVWMLYAANSAKGYQRIKNKEVNGTLVYYSEWTATGREWLVKMFEEVEK